MTPNDTPWPRISIVTPCFNHKAFIEATILSILEQGYPNLEYVIIDGGSTDGSVQIIEKYASRLAYWHTSPDKGQYEAINTGFMQTSGEIMAWLNSDDLLHRNALWTVAEIFHQLPQVEWMMGNPSKFDLKGRTVSVGPVPRWSRYRFLTGDWLGIQQESVFWRRSLWEKAGGYLDQAYDFAADLELWARFFFHAKLYTTSALIGGFRVSSDQKSRKYRSFYDSEARQIISNMPRLLQDDYVLKKISFLARLKRLPLLRVSYQIRMLYESYFQYPHKILFDHQSQIFKLE